MAIHPSTRSNRTPALPLLLGLAACAPDEDSQPSGPNPPSPEELTSALRVIADLQAALPGAPDAEAVAALLEEAVASSDVLAEARADPALDVSLRFTFGGEGHLARGTGLAWPVAPRPEPPGFPPPPPGGTPGSYLLGFGTPSAEVAFAGVLPSLGYADADAFLDEVQQGADEAGWLGTELAGVDAGLSTWSTLGQVDFAWIATVSHASTFPGEEVARFLQTGEVADLDTLLALYEDDSMGVAALPLVGIQGESTTYLAVGADWFSSTASAWSGGAVFVDGCASLDDETLGAALQTAGAGAVLGWSGAGFPGLTALEAPGVVEALFAPGMTIAETFAAPYAEADSLAEHLSVCVTADAAGESLAVEHDASDCDAVAAALTLVGDTTLKAAQEDLDDDGYTMEEGDCHDGDPARHPGAAEWCDGVDTDCDGIVDEDDASDASTWYADADGDGFGDPAASTSACLAPEGFVAEATDCDDTSGDISPDAQERCDGLDDDCDGVVDEDDATDAPTWCQDGDGDGFGDGTTGVTACEAPEGYLLDASDCDDTSAAIFPGADERCDGEDNDCDGTADEDDATDALTWYWDGDGDGFGDSAMPRAACEAPSGFVADATDCDDSVDLVFPGADERCDGQDDDCDGIVDEDEAVDAPTWFADMDGDGFGDAASPTTACSQPSDFVS
ncbi:MAG: putative metal-binding motif-containing protein, partial [Pseudomonadota bacterium]